MCGMYACECLNYIAYLMKIIYNMEDIGGGLPTGISRLI